MDKTTVDSLRKFLDEAESKYTKSDKLVFGKFGLTTIFVVSDTGLSHCRIIEDPTLGFTLVPTD